MVDIDTSIDHSKDLTIFKVSGAISPADFVQTIKLYYQKEKPTKLTLWDLSEGGLQDVHLDDLEKMVLKLRPVSKSIKDAKTAIFTPVDLDFALSRIFDQLWEESGHNRRIEVFRNKKGAMDWLDV